MKRENPTYKGKYKNSPNVYLEKDNKVEDYKYVKSLNVPISGRIWPDILLLCRLLVIKSECKSGNLQNKFKYHNQLYLTKKAQIAFPSILHKL